MEITRETARYVAKLAKLEIADEDMESVCQGLGSILSYMDDINATVGADAGSVTGGDCPTRPDTVTPSMNRLMLLDNAPEHSDETLIVPRVVE
ncbi:MAG: Asp-tRNA(Asn)/Glu-tRNA(Gln) amidotransferase GatCAB subunit C [Oscillibacter sp.]|nr:Asp-tRNA(Asn)/Glu-tRNA(Gln) amidotransferase GatCAB subunit C [Oscillibacter sp.]